MYSDDDEDWTMLDPVDALHVQVAVAILTNNEGQLQVLMEENPDGPYTGRFVLPNQIMRDDKTIEEAAQDLCGEFELAGIKLEQSSTLSYQRIDPRSRVMTVGLAGAVPRACLEWVEDRNDVALIDIEMEGDIAMLSLGGMSIGAGFFHADVVGDAVVRMRQGVDYSLTPFAFLNEAFTYAELQSVHEALLCEKITPQWLRRKMSKRVFPGDKMIVGTKGLRRDALGKPAELFSLTYVSPDQRRIKRQGQLMRKRRAKLASR